MSRPNIESFQRRLQLTAIGGNVSAPIKCSELQKLLDYVAALELTRTDDINDLTLAQLEIERLSNLLENSKP